MNPTEGASRQYNIGNDQAMVLAVQGGDLHVHQRIGTHLIEELPTRPAVPPTDAQLAPSRLLNAGSQVVRFTGRDGELRRLAAWRDGPETAAVLLVHGGAGQGKTRLAHRFAEISRAAGWSPLQARHSRDAALRPVAVEGERLPATRAGLLLLVDYAERWPLGDLLALLLDKRLHGSAPLRVLLLSRPSGGWWQSLTYRLANSIGVRTDSMALPALGSAERDAHHMYAVAVDCFAETLKVDGIGDLASRPPVFTDDEASALTIQMAALASVLAAQGGSAPPDDPAGLSAYLLARERSHWQAMYDNERRVESTPRMLGRAVHLAVLTRAMDYSDAVDVLRATSVATDPGAAARILDDHAMCYPPHDPAFVLEPLYPDRLAEDFVALQTPGHAVDGYQPDAWAAGVSRALLVGGDGSGAGHGRYAATVLALLTEASRRWPHLAERQLLPLLREQPDLVVRGGGAVLSAVAATPLVSLDVLDAIESALPTNAPADLHTGIAALTERLVAGMLDQSADPRREMRLCQKLGWRLTAAGHLPAARRALWSAVEIGRRLVAQDRSQHGAELALALRSLGAVLVRMADWATASDVLSQAARLWADPASAADPPAEDLAECLADLSRALWHEGRTAEALVASQRAVATWRRAPSSGPGHRLRLVQWLNQQAGQLRQGLRYAEALSRLDEALSLWQELAARYPVGGDPEFANTLLVRGRTLRSLRRKPEALASITAAVAVFRQLAEVNIAYEHGLARSLVALADALGDLDRWPEAIEAQDEAVAIDERLTRINLDRYGLDLVRSSLGFAALCRSGGVRYPDALARSVAAGSLLNGRVRADGATRAELLTTARSLAAGLLDLLGRPEEAEAVRRHGHMPPHAPAETSGRGGARHAPAPPSPSQPARPSAAQSASRIAQVRAALRSGDSYEAARLLSLMSPAAAGWALSDQSPLDVAAILMVLPHGFAAQILDTIHFDVVSKATVSQLINGRWE